MSRVGQTGRRGPGGAYKERSKAELRRLERDYLSNEHPLSLLFERFKMSNTEFARIRDREGWPMRSLSTKPKSANRALKQPTHRQNVQTYLERVAEDEKRYRDLYGDALPDVNLLRRRGYVVTREGDGVRVGNALCSFAKMRAIASRERRLAEAAMPAPVLEAMREGGRPLGSHRKARAV